MCVWVSVRSRLGGKELPNVPFGRRSGRIKKLAKHTVFLIDGL